MRKAQTGQYKHVTLEERVTIYALKSLGKTLRAIAHEIQRDVGTVSRELKRNKSRCDLKYFPTKAHENAVKRGIDQRTKAPLKNHEIYLYVRDKLRNAHWSPEEIAGRLPIDHPGESIVHETIYQYIFGKGKRHKLWKFLVRHHKRRRTKSGRRVQISKPQSKIPGAVSIDLRLKRANNRSQIGHLETDLMEGKKSQKTALSILVDRKSRHTNLRKVKNKTSCEKQKVLTSQVKQLQSVEKANKLIVRSVTADNGSENTNHDKISQELNIKWYFCHPYHSWEKGTVENTIGRVRRYVPKGTSIKKLTDVQIQWIENKLNNTPRKCLNFLTPNEVMEKEVNRYKFRKYQSLKEQSVALQLRM